MSDYDSTLSRMADLDDLTNFLTDTRTNMGNQKEIMRSTLEDMKVNIDKVKSQIESIKKSGASAKGEVIKAITEANKKQEGQLQKIKTNISDMLSLSNLESAVNELTKGVDSLVVSADSPLNAIASEFTPQNPPPGQPPTIGGYTYGKSRRGKGKRRRRGKNSRKKGRR